MLSKDEGAKATEGCVDGSGDPIRRVAIRLELLEVGSGTNYSFSALTFQFRNSLFPGWVKLFRAYGAASR